MFVNKLSNPDSTTGTYSSIDAARIQAQRAANTFQETIAIIASGKTVELVHPNG
jgi:hypothetical protein